MTQDDWTKKRDEAARNHNAKKQGSKIDFKAGWNACRAEIISEFDSARRTYTEEINGLLKERVELMARNDKKFHRYACDVTRLNSELDALKAELQETLEALTDTAVARDDLIDAKDKLTKELSVQRAQSEFESRHREKYRAESSQLLAENLRLTELVERDIGSSAFDAVVAENEKLKERLSDLGQII